MALENIDIVADRQDNVGRFQTQDMRTHMLNRWQRREVCKHFLRACRVVAIAGIAVGFWAQVDITLGMSAAVAPVLFAFWLLLIPVSFSALAIGLWIGEHVAEKRGMSVAASTPLKRGWGSLCAVVAGVIEGAPRWVVCLAVIGIAGAVILPGKGEMPGVYAATAGEARIAANGCLLGFSLTAPVLFSRSARAVVRLLSSSNYLRGICMRELALAKMPVLALRRMLNRLRNRRSL